MWPNKQYHYIMITTKQWCTPTAHKLFVKCNDKEIQAPMDHGIMDLGTLGPFFFQIHQWSTNNLQQIHCKSLFPMTAQLHQCAHAPWTHHDYLWTNMPILCLFLHILHLWVSVRTYQATTAKHAFLNKINQKRRVIARKHHFQGWQASHNQHHLLLDNYCKYWI